MPESSNYDLSTWQGSLRDELPFDGRPVQIDLQALRDACPFVPGREPDITVPSNSRKRHFFIKRSLRPAFLR